MAYRFKRTMERRSRREQESARNRSAQERWPESDWRKPRIHFFRTTILRKMREAIHGVSHLHTGCSLCLQWLANRNMYEQQKHFSYSGRFSVVAGDFAVRPRVIGSRQVGYNLPRSDGL